MNQPWETSLAWADAYADLPGEESSEIDRIVTGALLELLDDGLVYFYEADDWGPTFTRDVSDADHVPRERVVEIASEGSERTPDGRIRAPWLLMRATPEGRERHFELRPVDRIKWEEA